MAEQIVLTDEQREELSKSGLGIYEVQSDGVSYWVISVSPKEAVRNLRKNLFEIDPAMIKEMDENGDEFSAEKMPMDKELTFHSDRKAIKHTVEDWIVIYECCNCEPYLACSEF